MEPEVNAMESLISAITSYLTQALTWMGQIFTWVISQPLILFFMAIGLAGVMFRWARKVLHF